MNRLFPVLSAAFLACLCAAESPQPPTVTAIPDRPGIVESVNVAEEGGAWSADLREAFGGGAETVRMRFPVPDPGRFAGRDIAFVAALRGESDDEPAKVAAMPGVKRGDGAVWQSKGRLFPSVVEIGRDGVRIESACPVPDDATDVFLDLEFTAPGGGRLFIDSVEFGDHGILSSEPPEVAAEPPAKFGDSMTPVAAVLRRDPTKPAPVPPPWNIADWVWSEPWRDPVAPPPPNPAILPPAGASGVPAGMRLLADVDPAALALSGDTNRFASTGTWKTGELGGVRFLEAGDGHGDRYAVRFLLDTAAPLLCFEIDYPDDRARTADFTVFASSAPKFDYGLQAGVETGIEHPLTGKIATKRYLYWPRETAAPAEGEALDITLIAMTRGAGESAAVSRVRVYAIDSGALPAVGEAAAPSVAAPRRNFAIRYEDPAVTWDFGAGFQTLDGTKRVIDRLAAYMKFTGADTLVYPAVWYPGLICDRYKPRPHVPHYLREICRRFDRDGLGFYASMNQHRFPGLEGALSLRSLLDGSLADSPVSLLDTGYPNWAGWHFTKPYFNISHPAVQDAILTEIDAILDECAGHPSFKGIYIDLFNSVNALWWGSLEAGYNAYTIAAFCRERAEARLPDKDAQSLHPDAQALHPDAQALPCATQFAAALRSDPALLEEWIDWRCETLTRLYGRMAARMAAHRPDLRLWVGASPPWRPRMAARPDLRDGDMIDRSLREAGIDAARLANIPNLSLGVLTMPCWYRDELRKTKGVSESDIEFVRDLPETPGAYAPARETGFPSAILHDSYYETAIGSPPGKVRKSGDGRLRAPWLVEPGWRVTHFNASGREALRPYAKALAHGDLFAFAKGGFLVSTLGTEEVLAPFMRHFRALPAVKFEDAQAHERAEAHLPDKDAQASHPDAQAPSCATKAILRTAVVDGVRWYYALNTGFAPCVIRLPPGLRDAVTGEALPTKTTLDSYELRAMNELPRQLEFDTNPTGM